MALPTLKTKRIYTAWDNRKDEKRLFAGLDALVKHNVKPHEIMVYILIGYWPGETHEDRDYRRQKLRDFGALPYPMPFVRTPELVGFQRWVIGRYDKMDGVSWERWTKANYLPTAFDKANTDYKYEPRKKPKPPDPQSSLPQID